MITTGSDEDDGDGTLWGRKSRRQSTRRKTSDDAHGAAPLGAAPRIIAGIRKNPRTVGEIMVDLRHPHQTATSDVNKLMREGVLVDSKKRRRNPESGREAIVWEWCGNPRPIHRERPTRAQLEARNERAIELIEMGAASSLVIVVLKGALQ